MKKLIVFDLDGTLAESKSPLDVEMATLLGTLLSLVKVAIISGGDWPQFEKQVLRSSLSQSNYAVEKAGDLSIQVQNPDETKRVIKAIIDSLDGAIELVRKVER